MKHCIVLASGSGMRFGADVPKQFVRVDGRMIVEYTLAACDCGVFDDMILVVSASYVEVMKGVIQNGGYTIPIKVVEGGTSRLESCARGVEAIEDDDGMVIIHNGVQPLVKRKTFETCLEALVHHSVVVTGVPCTYTILDVDSDGFVQSVPDRRRLRVDMGEEGFDVRVLRQVIRAGVHDDDVSNLVGIAIKHRISQVFVVPGDVENVKLTYRDDLAETERALIAKKGEGGL